jgi:hypothetical protein
VVHLKRWALFAGISLTFLSGSSVALADSPTVIVLTATSSSTWTVPSDWNSASNTIETIGAGASGDAAAQGYMAPGGGGGAWNEISNLSLTPGASISYQVGAGGASQTATLYDYPGNAGGNTWFNGTSLTSASVSSQGGGVSAGSGAAAPGGLASAGVGSGHNGGAGGSVGLFGQDSSGGGGAAGPSGPGVAGIDESSFQSASAGGAGDNGMGGAGGTSSVTGTPGAGGTGTEYDSTHGSGGGGGGAAQNGGTGAGGYGGGGGGSEQIGSSPAVSGPGGQGIIVITYTPAGGTPFPPAPTGFHVSTSTQTSITLGWTSGGASTTSYLINIAEGTTAPDCSTGASTTATSFTESGLTASTTYTMSLCASDSLGALSSPVTVTATTLNSSGGGGGSGGGGYTYNGDHTGGAAGSYGGGGGAITEVNNDSIGPAISGAGAPGVIILRYYPVGYNLVPPPAPTGLNIASESQYAFNLSWSSGGGTTYKYLVAIAAGSSAPSCSGGTVSTSTTFLAGHLRFGTTYTASVCAVDAFNTISSAATITGTTLTNSGAGAAPAVAQTAGFNTPTFYDDFAATSSIDTNDTGSLNQYQWFTANPGYGVGYPTLPSSDISVNSSVLTLSDDVSGAGYGISTYLATSTPAGAFTGPNWGGLGFANGGYFEVRASFDPNQGQFHLGPPVPAFWMEGYLGIPSCVENTELDLFEAFGTASTSPPFVDPVFSVNDWTPDSNCNFTSYDLPNSHATLSSLGNPDFSQMHSYGTLWIPASKNDGVHGLIERFFDGVHISSLDLTYPDSGGNYTKLDQDIYGLILGGGHNWPLNVDWVKVWQTAPSDLVSGPVSY